MDIFSLPLKMKYLKTIKDSKKNCYDVEYIITRKIKGNKKFYLIKWEGYPLTGCSWEPISHLYNVIDMVKEFEENFPQSINHKVLKEFYSEYKKYKLQNHLRKKRELKKGKEKNAQSNKIIIELDNDNDTDLTNNDEKGQNEENFNELNKNIKNKFEKVKVDCPNVKCLEKLIKPIIIW